MLTLARLKEVLDCDPEAGTFTWKIRRQGVVFGASAGYSAGRGYKQIKVDGVAYSRHRLVWLYVKGVWPTWFLDHKNGIPGDDRIDNLREATPAQNSANCRIKKNNQTGFKGVSFTRKTGRWNAKISLGTFNTPEEAHAAYCRAAVQLHGEFARVS